MKVILPMAGRGSRFHGSNHSVPKPLIDVGGKPMFLRAIESLRGINYSNIYVVALMEHEHTYGLSKLVKKYLPKSQLILVKNTPAGQLLSVMKVKKHIDTQEDLLIMSSDTLVISPLNEDIEKLKRGVSGIISVIKIKGDNWSFVKIDKKGCAVQVAEKERISNLASTGLYYFSKGTEFIRAAQSVIRKKMKVNNEYYIMPVYKEFIDKGFCVKISMATEIWDMGNPQALKHYLINKPNYPDTSLF